MSNVFISHGQMLYFYTWRTVARSQFYINYHIAISSCYRSKSHKMSHSLKTYGTCYYFQPTNIQDYMMTMACVGDTKCRTQVTFRIT